MGTPIINSTWNYNLEQFANRVLNSKTCDITLSIGGSKLTSGASCSAVERTSENASWNAKSVITSATISHMIKRSGRELLG